MTTCIKLPWPPRELSPNSRAHWSKKARCARDYKFACFALAKQARLSAPPSDTIDVFLEFSPPDRRRRDHDNMIALAKYALDGVAAAVGVDDRRFVLRSSVADDARGEIRISM